MNERVKRLSEEIRKLSPEERAELLDEIVEALDESDRPELEQALLNEIERRISAYDQGGVAVRDAREALAKYKEK
jgi:putative addiction module component (TIGR02574 family)